MSARRAGATVAIVLSLAAVLTGCRLPSFRDLPVPAAVTGPTYTLRAQLRDTLNLPLGAKVKLNGAVIGEVTAISTHDFRAELTLRMRQDAPLLVGSTFQVRFTTPLGENYLAVSPPRRTAEPERRLREGDLVPLADTSAAPSIEDTFAAVSVLINGGGLTKVSTILHELNRAVHGREGTLSTALVGLQDLVRDLNAQRGSLVSAARALRDLSRELQAGNAVIDKTLTTLPRALELVREQNQNLHRLLVQVDRLGVLGSRVLGATSASVLNGIDDLAPVLTEFAKVRDQVGPTLRTLTRFGERLRSVIPGDYLLADSTVHLVFSDQAQLPGNYPSGEANR